MLHRPRTCVPPEDIVRLHLALFSAPLAPGAIQVVRHLKLSVSPALLVTTVFSRLCPSTTTFVPEDTFALLEHHTGFNIHAQADTLMINSAPSRKTHVHFVRRVIFVLKEVPPSGQCVQQGMSVGSDPAFRPSALQARGPTSRAWSLWNSARIAHQEATAWREAAIPRLVHRGHTHTCKVPCRERSVTHVMQAGHAPRLV